MISFASRVVIGASTPPNREQAVHDIVDVMENPGLPICSAQSAELHGTSTCWMEPT